MKGHEIVAQKNPATTRCDTVIFSLSYHEMTFALMNQNGEIVLCSEEAFGVFENSVNEILGHNIKEFLYDSPDEIELHRMQNFAESEKSSLLKLK